MHNISVPWNDEKKMAGKDWFLSFMKRHKDEVSLRKPEALSKARAMGLNQKAVDEFYNILNDVTIEFGLNDQPKVFTMSTKADFL